jgi:hypothetical protein
MTEYAVIVAEEAPEADWYHAPTVMESVETVRLPAEHCGLNYWYRNVASVAAKLRNGHQPDVLTPEHMLEPGGFREALLREFAFRAIAEEKAARAIGKIVAAAPNAVEMNFYATQVIDEARHAEAFKAHIGEIVGASNVDATVETYSRDGRAKILDPLEDYALNEMQGSYAYLIGVATLTILVEGVLAPTGELSERKWACIDPAAASVERGASIDEVRHLAVGSEIIKNAVHQSPAAASAVADVVARGLQYWTQLPVIDEMRRREELFQEGMDSAGRDVATVLADYECWPGTLLRNTTCDVRINKALEWSVHAQSVRLEYMGVSGDGIKLV